MSHLKHPGQKVKSHRFGSEVISHCLEFNYYCLGTCTSTAAWISLVNVCRGGKQRANLYQHPHSHFCVHVYWQRLWDSYQIQLWVCPKVEMGCERKSVGSRGVEPSHPVVTSHTAPPIRSRTCEALTFFSAVCEFRHWIFL